MFRHFFQVRLCSLKVTVMLNFLDAFPAKYAKNTRREIFVYVILIVCGAYITAFSLINCPIVVTSLFGAIFLFTLYLFVETLRALKKVAVIPYFNEAIPGEWDFKNGNVVARNIRFLDELARSIDTAPLSDFGYADDLGGDQLTWHDPARGINTVNKLVKIIADDSTMNRSDKDHLHEVEKALISLRSRLEIALAHDARFALLIKHPVISGLEVERRLGFF